MRDQLIPRHSLAGELAHKCGILGQCEINLTHEFRRIRSTWRFERAAENRHKSQDILDNLAGLN